MRACAGRWRQVAGEELHGGALAGAVGAQKRHHFALVYLEADILDGRKTAVILRQSLGLDHGGSRGVGHSDHSMSDSHGRRVLEGGLNAKTILNYGFLTETR